MSEITVNIRGRDTVRVQSGTTLLEISEQHGPPTALIAKVDNELMDLARPLLYDATVEFLDITDPQGFRAYQRGVTFLMVYAAKTVFEKKTRVVVCHSINKNFWCELPEIEDISVEKLAEIEDLMHECVKNDMPIVKHTMPKEQAIRYLESVGLYDKIAMLRYRHNMTYSFYKLDWLYNYFYGEMVPRTGRLGTFKLLKRPGGFILNFPDATQNYLLTEFAPPERISEVLHESNQWARIMKTDAVGSLNDKICEKGSGEVIRVAEALHEKKIAMLADEIMRLKRRIVLIAGPSSSGKTTFATRLGVQLNVTGAQAHIIGLDNYYINRDQIPADEHGNQDLETIAAIDTPRLAQDLRTLLDGKEAIIPKYNFFAGRRETRGRPLRLGNSDVLIVEGIHGLNDAVCADMAATDVFKIFISALTQINIDDHNRIPTTDSRLLRRMVRDSLFRGAGASDTLDMWPSVLRGEVKYIYPFQDKADAFFNSTLVYEMCILKQYAQPLLFAIRADEPQYTEARRLIRFLASFLSVPSENVPPNSILREFIGGSCFSH